MTKKRIAACRLARSTLDPGAPLRSLEPVGAVDGVRVDRRRLDLRLLRPRRLRHRRSVLRPSRRRVGKSASLGVFGHTARRDGDRFAAAGATGDDADRRPGARGVRHGDARARRRHEPRRRRSTRSCSRRRSRPAPRSSSSASLDPDGRVRRLARSTARRQRSPPSSRARASSSQRCRRPRSTRRGDLPESLAHRPRARRRARRRSTCRSSPAAGSSAALELVRGRRFDQTERLLARVGPTRSRRPCGRSSRTASPARARTRRRARSSSPVRRSRSAPTAHARPRRSSRLAAESAGARAAMLWRREGDGDELVRVASFGATASVGHASRRLARVTAGGRADLGGRTRSTTRSWRRSARTPAGIGAPARLRPGGRPGADELGRLAIFGVRAAHALRATERSRTLEVELERTRALLAAVAQANEELSLAHTLSTVVGRVAQLLETDRHRRLPARGGPARRAPPMRALEGRARARRRAPARARARPVPRPRHARRRRRRRRPAPARGRERARERRHRGGDRRAAARAGRGRRPARRLSCSAGGS